MLPFSFVRVYTFATKYTDNFTLWMRNRCILGSKFDNQHSQFLRTTTKNDNFFVRNRRFRRFVVLVVLSSFSVFFLFISFRRLRRLLRLFNGRFLCRSFFQKKLPFSDRFFFVRICTSVFGLNARMSAITKFLSI